MKDEEKKNEYPVPSGGAVRTSYILFLIVMIFMLIFCALFLSSASAEASYTAGGGTTGNDTAASSVSIGAGRRNGAVTNGPDCVSIGAAAAAENGATAAGAHSAVDVAYGVALGAYTEAHRQTDDGGYYMPEGASEAEKQAVSNTARAADGKYYGVASIGNNEHTRQLVGVAAGSLDTDAANVAQLKALEGAMSRSVETAKKKRTATKSRRWTILRSNTTAKTKRR